MTESEAVVVRLDGDDVWLEIRDACSSCGGSAGCGLGDGKGRRPQRLRNTIGARVGDTVVLAVPEGAVLRAVFYCYLLPLLVALAGAASGMIFGGEPGAMLGAVVGLAGGWLVMRRAGRREPAPAMRLKAAVVHLHRNPTT
jgi:sigma-E factor negative regulatory protein RseC